MSGRHHRIEEAVPIVGAVEWRHGPAEFRRKTPYFDSKGDPWWESLLLWSPFDQYGQVRSLKAEGWVTIGYLTDDGPELKK